MINQFSSLKGSLAYKNRINFPQFIQTIFKPPRRILSMAIKDKTTELNLTKLKILIKTKTERNKTQIKWLNLLEVQFNSKKKITSYLKKQYFWLIENKLLSKSLQV